MSEEFKIKKTRGITGTTLKIIAIVTMLIDHVGAAIIEKIINFENLSTDALMSGNVNSNILNLFYTDSVLRLIGRIAFPIFCFLLVEGFLHTRDIKKYALRLFVFALISEIPFDLAFSGNIFSLEYQNVFFTLLIGLLTIWGIKLVSRYDKIKKLILSVVIVALGMVIAKYMKTDYGSFGVAAIVLLYVCSSNRKLQCILGAIIFSWEVTAILSFVIIYFYNGERGIKLNKYLFYAFYPAHILILYFIYRIIIMKGTLF